MDKSKQIVADAINSEKIEETSSRFTNVYANAKQLRRAIHRIVQNFLLIWLDSTIDEIENNDCINTISKLREVVNTVHTFTDFDECIDFISNIHEETISIISSGEFGQTTASAVGDMSQVSAVYIFYGNKVHYEQCTKEWPKVKGVFTDIKPICEELKQAAQECDQNTISMSFVAMSSDATNKNLNQLDQSFMYTQILKEILLTIDFKEQHIQEFLKCCQELFAGNKSELKNVYKLEKEYHEHAPIWWYTYQCFLYSMLNRALRTMELDLIVTMGFFVRDLLKHIEQLHFEQYAGHTHSNTFTVYRGQGLSQKDFDQLVKTKGGLLSFNNFLSTSMDREVSLAFAESNADNPDLIGVLFEITIDSNIPSTCFANVRDVTYFKGEEEILFSMHSIFRIAHIQRIDSNNNRLWQVHLTLTSDNDPDLHALTEHIRKETYQNAKGWYRMGELLIKVGQYDKAQQVCEIMFNQKPNARDTSLIYNMLGKIKDARGEYTQAITYYEKSIELNEKILSPIHFDLAASYGNIGSVYKNMGEYSKALSYYKKTLEIQQKTLPQNHPSLAASYNHIGLVYDHMGAYSKALSSHEKALEIYQKTLPPNHPSLATSYNNIGLVYYNMGEYSKAFSSHEKALEIRQKTLPQNHPDFAISYNNIGLVYNNISEYSKAFLSHEKALEIRQKILTQNHPHLAISYNNIGLVYNNISEYSKALSYYEKALEIYQKLLLQNHPHLAISYNNIGQVYYNMGDYLKALSSHEKALEVRQKILPQNHPHLATSYNNIGRVYDNMGEYSKALSYYEKTLEIYQKALPQNHHHLATSYNNMGRVCDNMGEYSKALSYFERALDIGQHSLPENHPDLQTYKKNVEIEENKL